MCKVHISTYFVEIESCITLYSVRSCVLIFMSRCVKQLKSIIKRPNGNECSIFTGFLLFTTLTSSCRARYRIKSTRASFIQILIPRRVTRIARSLREGCGRVFIKLREFVTHEIVVAQCLPQGVKK